jgi:hypothetical protein
MKAKLLALLVGMALVSCRSRVGVLVGGRPAESLSAQLESMESGWKIVAELPLGDWKPKLKNDPYPVETVQHGGRKAAVWRFDLDRFRSARKFTLELYQGDSDQPSIVLEFLPSKGSERFTKGVLRVVYECLRGEPRYRPTP